MKDFRLQDSDFEKTFGCNLTKMLAKQDRHKLFEVSFIDESILKNVLPEPLFTPQKLEN